MNFLYKLKRWLVGLFIINHEGPFGWSPEEFNKARRWAKNQPHLKFPSHPSYSLWDYVKANWIDSEWKLHEINKRRVAKLNKNKKKV